MTHQCTLFVKSLLFKHKQRLKKRKKQKAEKHVKYGKTKEQQNGKRTNKGNYEFFNKSR